MLELLRRTSTLRALKFPHADKTTDKTVRSRTTGKTFKEFRRSSPRFNVELPAVFWAARDSRAEGKQSVTKNVSRTGLYFQGAYDIAIGSPIYFELELPAPFGGGIGGVLRGRGRLVRSETRGNKRIGFAATIDRYEFRPMDDEAPPGVKKHPAPKPAAT